MKNNKLLKSISYYFGICLMDLLSWTQ